MTPKEAFAAVVAAQKATTPEPTKSMLIAARTMELTAVLSTATEPLPPDIFDCLDDEGRALALWGFVTLCMAHARTP